MGKTAEDNQWFKGKGEVSREYRGAVKNLNAAVASRGFTRYPGFAIQGMTDVEIGSKYKMVELNQQIMAAAIERELRAYGLENEVRLKEALMAWEMEKQELLSALQREFADLDRIRGMEDAEIDELIIEQEMREVGILMAKTAIEIEMEGVKKQIEEVDLIPMPYQEQLAAARMVTAQRKLEVIPYIMATIENQRAVMDAEESVIFPARMTRVEMQNQIGGKLMEIIPYLVQKANALMLLANRQAELIPLMIDKAGAIMSLTTEQRELFPVLMEKAEATRTLAEQQKELIPSIIDKAQASMTLSSRMGDLLPLTMEKANAGMDLVTREGETLPLLMERVAATMSLTAQQETLLPLMIEKAAASQALAGEVVAQLVNRIQIAQVKIETAQELMRKIQDDTLTMEKELTLETEKLGVDAKRIAIQLKKALARIEVANNLIILLATLKSAATATNQAEIDYITTSGESALDIKEARITKIEDARYRAEQTQTTSASGAVISIAASDASNQRIMAEASAKAQITEKLIHLLA